MSRAAWTSTTWCRPARRGLGFRRIRLEPMGVPPLLRGQLDRLQTAMFAVALAEQETLARTAAVCPDTDVVINIM